jgi:hypothetical protein
MIRNRAYCGDLAWNKNSQGKYTRYQGGRLVQSDRPNRVARTNDGGELVVRPNAIEPIVDRETFTRVQDALAHNRKRTARADSRAYLLNRLLVCSHCGAYMTGGGRGRYVCATYHRFGRRCHQNAVREDAILPRIVQTVRQAVLNPDVLSELREELARRLDEQQGEPGRLREQLAALDAQVRQGARNLLLVTDPGAIDEMQRTLAGWRSEREQRAARLTTLERSRVDTETEVKRLEGHLWRLRDALADADPSAVQGVIREVVERVELRFTHHPCGKRILSRLDGGTVVVREVSVMGTSTT